MRKSKPWFHQKWRKWVTKSQGKLIVLAEEGASKDDIEKAFYRFMSKRVDEKEGNITVKHAVELFLESYEKNPAKRPKTVENYRYFLESFQVSCKLSNLSPWHIEDHLIKTFSDASPWTRHGFVRSLRTMCRWCVRMRLCPEVAIDWKQWKQTLEPRRANVSKEDFTKFLETADKQFQDFAWLLWHTGCRPSEMLKIVHGVAKTRGGVAIIESSESKRKIEHRIYLNTEAQALVKKHKYLTKFGNPYTRMYVSSRFRILSERSGIKLIPYGLRHSAASRLLASKVPTATAAKLLNTSVTMLDRVYGQLSDDELIAISQQLS